MAVAKTFYWRGSMAWFGLALWLAAGCQPVQQPDAGVVVTTGEDGMVVLSERLRPGSPAPVVVEVEDNWLEREQHKTQLLQELRERAGNTNDPFALSLEEIEELSQRDSLYLL